MQSTQEENWTERARCKLEPQSVDFFFPESHEFYKTVAAKEFCSTCGVKQECLDYALRSYIKFGIWGGTSENQRIKMRKSLQLPQPSYYMPETGQWIKGGRTY